MRFTNDSKKRDLIQFIKFGLVGVSNTLISYGVEMLFYYVVFKEAHFTTIISWCDALGIVAKPESVSVVIATAIAFIISVTNSYVLNNRFVFKHGRKDWKGHLKTYGKTVLCYATTGLVLAPIIKITLMNAANVPLWVASIFSLTITVPLNFVLNKLWAFAPAKETEKNNVRQHQ